MSIPYNVEICERQVAWVKSRFPWLPALVVDVLDQLQNSLRHYSEECGRLEGQLAEVEAATVELQPARHELQAVENGSQVGPQVIEVHIHVGTVAGGRA